MNQLRVFILFILILSFTKNGQSQIVEDALENVRANYASEKIYIHYDKESYVAGETVWFKVYIMSGFVPSLFSSSVCVELLNDSGRITDKQILPVINSVATGSFALSRDAKQLNYTVRAYTRRLMNFGTTAYYYQQLPVFNPSASPVDAVTKEYGVYFLPESGNFIAGVKNVVAFKCTDQWSYPAEIEGTIVNSSGAIVADFKSVHDGMGKFEFVPVKGESYSATCNIDHAVNKKINLPLSHESGVLLQIQKQADKTYFLINSETVKNEDEVQVPAYLLAVMENTVIFKIPFPKDQKNFRGVIPVNDIPTGIVQVTVFNNNNQPLAERLLFVSNKDFIADGKFNTNTASTASRSRNEYSFELADSIAGSFSVAVTDLEKKLDLDNADNIFSHFLLTNDIRGYVHNPAYYFAADDDEHKNNLDLVMLTNGWRKFNWDEILNKRLPVMSYKDQNYISLKGLVYDEDSKSLTGETNLNVFIQSKDAHNDIAVIPVNKESGFEIPGLIFNDSATFYIMDLFAKNKKRTLQFNNLSLSTLFNTPSSFARPAKSLSLVSKTGTIKNIYSKVPADQDRKAILLSEVTVKTKAKSKIKQLEERYIRNGVFNSYAAATLDLTDTRAYGSNIFEYLKARLPGVTINGSGGDYTLNYRNSMSLRSGLIPMTLFLNESQVTSIDIASIPVTDIAMVKLYSTGFVGAEGNGAGGVLAVYTKKGEDYKVPGTDNMTKIKVEGFSPVKEFFSPDYSPGKTVAQTEDNRTTLYWDPYLETDPANKKITFSFYNADHAKKFRIVLEGLTADGKLVHVEKIIE